MRAARIEFRGAAPVIEDIATPRLGRDEVLVRVAAAALNPLDVKLNPLSVQEQDEAVNAFFKLDYPYTVGLDLAGIVVEADGSASQWRPGDKVVARLDPVAGGAMAEFAAVPAAFLTSAPPSIDLERAAGIPSAGGTAYEALFEVGNLQAGQTILIHAAAGGVGSFAVQFAKATGARVLATASGEGMEIARRLGSDRVIDHRVEDFTELSEKVDLVVDTIGGSTQARSFEIIRRGGMIVSVVVPPDPVVAAERGVAARFVTHMSNARRLARVVEMVAQGAEVLIDGIEPLDAIESAFRRQASGRAKGKIILRL